jgi:hypothetical protein
MYIKGTQWQPHLEETSYLGSFFTPIIQSLSLLHLFA